MDKKYIVPSIAIVLIIILAGLAMLNAKRKAGILIELDNLSNEMNQLSEDQINKSLEDFDSIQELEDSYNIDIDVDGSTASNTNSAIDVSDLEDLLKAANQAEQNASKSITEFDSIKESEDNISF